MKKRVKNRRGNLRTRRSGNQMLEKITGSPAYQGNKLVTLALPGAPSMLTNTVTTGLLAFSYSVNPVGGVAGWSTRFGSTFDEWRLASVVFEIIPVGLNVGVTSFFWSENSISVTLTEADERSATWIKNNEQRPKNLRMRWRNQDYTDASFRNVSTGFNDVYFYAYTDATNMGAPVTATNLFVLRPVFYVQFRGIAST